MWTDHHAIHATHPDSLRPAITPTADDRPIVASSPLLRYRNVGRRRAVEVGPDGTGDVRSTLDRSLRDAGHRRAAGGGVGNVADREHVAVAGHGEIRFDLDAPGAVDRCSESPCEG